jgi:hypothetical protein
MLGLIIVFLPFIFLLLWLLAPGKRKRKDQNDVLDGSE